MRFPAGESNRYHPAKMVRSQIAGDPATKQFLGFRVVTIFRGTAKRIQDRSIISSIKPKFDDLFFVDLLVL